MKTIRMKFVNVFLAAMCMSAIVWAQSGGSFSITESVVAGGGGNGIGGIFSLDYTIGQTVAGGTIIGAPYDIAPGFWPDSSPVATSSPTPPSVSISGTVTYGNAVSGPQPPRFVSNVLISGAGSPSVSVFTGAPGPIAGTYSLTGFGAGSYAVTPSKTGGVNGITSFDAAKIAQHVAGIGPLTGNQLLVADVSNNGIISSFDAAQIARYVTSAPPFGITGTWKFSPLNRAYSTVNTNISGEDYTALLMGEVSGNWTNTGARPVGEKRSAIGSETAKTIAVTAPNMIATTDSEVIIPIGVQGIENMGIISYEFDLKYDPTVMQPRPDPVDLDGTLSSRLSVVANTREAGLLRVVVYGPIPIEASGELLKLRFHAIGILGSVSHLTWKRVMFNEGDPGITAADGKIELFSAR